MRKIYFLVFAAMSLGLNAQNFAWTAQTSSSTDNLRDVYFTDNMNGWVVGDNGTILHTNNGGANWASQTSGTTINITDVYFIDANNGYAVGGFLSVGNVALKTIDGGVNWTTITVGSTADSYTDVDFSSVNHGIIITKDSIYTTSNAGSTWEKEGYVSVVAGGLNNSAVSSFNDSIALVCGSSYKTGSTVNKKPEIFDRRLNNAPDVWGTSAATNFDANDLIKTIEVAGPTRAFAGGEEGIVYKFESVGPNFSGPWIVSIDLMSATKLTIGSISFPTDKLGMFNTSADTNGNSYAIIYHTIDEGNTWTSVPDSIQGLLQSTLHAPTPNDAWIVGSAGKIYKGVPNNIGVDENFLATMRVYPNPAKEILNINLGENNNTALNYRIIDITGKTLVEGALTETTQTVNISGLSQGVYFISIANDNGGVKTMKFNKI